MLRAANARAKRAIDAKQHSCNPMQNPVPNTPKQATRSASSTDKEDRHAKRSRDLRVLKLVGVGISLDCSGGEQNQHRRADHRAPPPHPPCTRVSRPAHLLLFQRSPDLRPASDGGTPERLNAASNGGAVAVAFAPGGELRLGIQQRARGPGRRRRKGWKISGRVMREEHRQSLAAVAATGGGPRVPARALMGRNHARVAARTRSKPKIRNISGPDSDRILRTALDIESMVQRL
jgi:hypothetical protein